MNRIKGLTVLAMTAAMMAVSSCGTKKIVADSVTTTTSTTTTTTSKGASAGKSTKTTGTQTKTTSNALEQMNFLRRVSDNAVYATNIVSKIKCTINTGSGDIAVGGSLHMRKDEVIRIQITPLGLMEAGRLEFTKDYVLFIDRLHKEYVKARYSDVDFLQRNSLDFYALQALFWNKLFIPGTTGVSDSALKNFKAELASGQTTDVTLNHGRMKYVWNTDSKSALINSLIATYIGGNDGNTSVSCKYGAFKSLGAKQFPTDITLSMSTKAVKNASKMMLRLQLNSITNESDWETKTTVSSKYKEVKMEELLGKLGSL